MKEMLSACATGALGAVVVGGVVTVGVSLHRFFCCSVRKSTSPALTNGNHAPVQAQHQARVAAKDRLITLMEEVNIQKQLIVKELHHLNDHQTLKTTPYQASSTVYSSTYTMFAQLSQKNQWLARLNSKRQTMWQTLNDAINTYPTAVSEQLDSVQAIDQFYQEYSAYHLDIMQLAESFFEESEQLLHLKSKTL